MTTQITPSERITEAVMAWDGVTSGMGDRGEFGFRVGRKEIGHLHGDRVAHFFFNEALGRELHAAGRVGPHPVNRGSHKLGAREIEGDADVDDVIAIMRLNYDRVTG